MWSHLCSLQLGMKIYIHVPEVDVPLKALHAGADSRPAKLVIKLVIKVSAFHPNTAHAGHENS